MSTNPPIAGHGLLYEGHVKWWRRVTTGEPVQPEGGCRCGAKPDGWPSVGVNETKRWHRQHKEILRGDLR